MAKKKTQQTPIENPWLAHYDPGVPRQIPIPNISLVDLFKEAVKSFGESVCIIYQDQHLSYQAVDRYSNQFAAWLISRGLTGGDRVGIFLPNSPEFVIAYYGILKAGGVVMALNPAYRPAELEAQARESGIRFMALSNSDYTAAKAIQKTTNLEGFLVFDAGKAASLPPEDQSWETIQADPPAMGAVDVEVAPDHPAVFQYSGGTTGTPKCAVGLHRNLVANVYQFSHWLVNTTPGDERILVAIPMYHVYGMVLGMNLAVRMGASMILIPNPRDLDALLEAAHTHRATLFPGVPNIYAAINRYPPVLQGEYDLSSIKACISGSATLPQQVKEEFEALTHGHLVEGYGLSEAPTATHCNPVLGENRPESIGLPLPNVDCKIVDLEEGSRELPVGEAGELIIKGPQVMAGYYDRPEETALTLREGWLYTGDVARMDAEGYFYLVDRKKDVIKVGGFQVWPKEIEAVLIRHDAVQEAAVAGVRDAEGAEMPKAWVVLREGEQVTPGELQEFCRQYLTGYKIPEIFEFRESLPRTGVGKVLRRVLAAENRPGQTA